MSLRCVGECERGDGLWRGGIVRCVWVLGMREGGGVRCVHCIGGGRKCVCVCVCVGGGQWWLSRQLHRP